jgi:hypothetical protein
VRDRRGRLVRSVTCREPEWTELDRAEVLALAEWRAGRCPDGCGHAAADTFSDEETGPVFKADRKVCRAQLALIEAKRAAENPDKPNPYAAARVWHVEMTRR